jgi:hypothetical protein
MSAAYFGVSTNEFLRVLHETIERGDDIAVRSSISGQAETWWSRRSERVLATRTYSTNVTIHPVAAPTRGIA